MPRPYKKGLDYFELDCYLDDKFGMIEAEFGDVSREIEVPGDAAAHFPYDGAESAGSQEEFEPTSDNSDGGSEQYNDKAEI